MNGWRDVQQRVSRDVYLGDGGHVEERDGEILYEVVSQVNGSKGRQQLRVRGIRERG